MTALGFLDAPWTDVGDLKVLLNPQSALALLQRAGLAVTHVRASYPRLKPGGGALVHLELEHRDPDGNATWHEGYAKTSNDHRARELHAKWLRLAPRPSPIGPGVTLLAGERTIVFLFPNDAGLRDLRFVSDLQKLKRALVALPEVVPEGWSVRAHRTRLETIRYKPEHRFVQRAHLGMLHEATGAKRSADVFLRFFSDDRGKRLDALLRTLRATHPDLPIPKPLGALPNGRMQAEAAVPGRRLSELLADGSLRSIETITDVLLAFAHLTLPKSSLLVGPQVPIPYQDDPRFLAKLVPHLSPLCEEIAASWSRRSEPRMEIFVHGDFHLHQILSTGTDTHVVDFERASLGARGQDLGSLLAHLHAVARREPSLAASALSSAAALEARWCERSQNAGDVALFLSAGLVKQALLAWRRLDPQWHVDAELLLTTARDAVAHAGLRPRSRLGPPPESSLDALDTSESQWTRVFPRGEGAWPGVFVDTLGREIHGLLDASGFRPLALDADPVLAAASSWYARAALVARRAGTRAVFSTNAEGRRVFLKVMKPRKARQALAVDQTLRHWLGKCGVFLPRVLEGHADAGVIVMEDLEGVPLVQALEQEPSSTVLERLCEALVRLHGASPPTLPDLQAVRQPTTDQLLSWVARYHPSLTDHYASVSRNLPEHPLGSGGAILHGDLHDGNIRMTSRGLGLLDFEGLRLGHVCEDLGNLGAHLVLKDLLAREASEAPNDLAHQLFDAYQGANGALAWNDYAGALARTLVRLAVIHLHRRPTRHLAEGLLRAGTAWTERALDQ